MNIDDTLDKFQNKRYYDKHIICLEKHLAKFFHEDEIAVFHEFLSVDFHLDVYFIKPSDTNYNILLTSGMSIIEMTVDDEIANKKDYSFAELMILLPKEIEFGDIYTGTEKNSWIISMLKQTSRFPHHYDTFISIGHTIQATEDMQSYSEETDFIGCVILPSVTYDSDFTEFKCGKNKVNIYSLFPLYKNELEYKIQNGYNTFLKLLIKANANEIFDFKRKNLM